MKKEYEVAFDELCHHVRETALLAGAESALAWDERTMLPAEATEFRAEQLTMLAGMLHARRTDKRIGEWLAILAGSPLAANPHDPSGTVIRELKRQYERRVKLPQSLVEELARTASLGQHAWEQARAKDDYGIFAPLLARMFALKRAEADALGYQASRYDALLDDYEPGERTANVARVLASLREALVPLVAEIATSRKKPDISILEREYPVPAQETLAKRAAEAIGFSFQRGRLDVTAHPFCTTLGPKDCRITTRYDERFFSSAFFGVLHEAGHGLYEQGLPTEWYGLPPGEAVSLGIHESQSRLWENLVGRSREFWQYLYPQAQKAFPVALGTTSLDAFYFAINDVRPSLVRVEADEATYNLHILIRFELEQAMLADEIPTADVPTAWNDKYEQYLGIRPKSDADGVLQDVHWSAGLVGYFPTYALGNLYAAQFFVQAEKDLGALGPQFARGEFAPLREWLNKNVHQHGQCYTAADLVQKITGKPLSHDPLIAHLRGKLAPLYGLN